MTVRTGFQKQVLMEMAAGGTAAQLKDRRAHPIVQTGVDVLQWLLKDRWPNFTVRAVATGSTDGNVGVKLGIPTIAMGRTFGRDQHTLTEAAEIEGTAPAPSRTWCPPPAPPGSPPSNPRPGAAPAPGR